MSNDEKIVQLNREAKLYLVGILKNGFITQNDVYKIAGMTNLNSLRIEVIDRREQVEKDIVSNSDEQKARFAGQNNGQF